jgi:hypothetical protein
VGIAALRSRLGKVLNQKILTVLPNVIREIEERIKKDEAELNSLGEARSGLREKLHHLIRTADKFKDIVVAGINGNYEGPFFPVVGAPAGTSGHRRLRAHCRSITETFAYAMDELGHTYSMTPMRELSGDIQDYEEVNGRPLMISEDSLRAKAQECINQSSGRELGGQYNPLAVSELFKIMSKHWGPLASHFLDKMCEACEAFLEEVLLEIAGPHSGSAIIVECLTPFMEERRTALEAKLEEVLLPHTKTHAITYNPAFYPRGGTHRISGSEPIQPIPSPDEVIIKMRSYYEVDLPPPCTTIDLSYLVC